MMHARRGKKEIPVCGNTTPGVFLTKYWSMVDCEECKKFDTHQWKKYATVITCEICGLVKGSGYQRCEEMP